MDLRKKEKVDSESLTERDPLVLESESNKPKPLLMQRGKCLGCFIILFLVAVAVALAVGLGVGLGVGIESEKSSSNSAVSLPDSIKASNLMDHLKELQKIADNSNSSRAVQYGYNESAMFIHDTLSDAGYDTMMQTFSVPIYTDEGNANFSAFVPNISFTWKFTLGYEFVVMRYSGNGSVTVNASLQPINGSTGDCVSSEFSNINGTVVLMDVASYNCSVFEQAYLAQNGGAAAVVMMDSSRAGSLPPNYRLYNQTVSGFEVIGIPVLGVTNQLGQDLLDLSSLAQGNLSVEIETATSVTMYETLNVIAETKYGLNSTVIVIGSHLDSVAAGPGINDNGSGSGANLEIALQIAKQNIRPKNKVRFAFWGAEELGLLGSNHYVMSLSEDERSSISLNLNFDMLASPNYVRKVYNGSEADEGIRNASVKIQGLFEDYFMSENLQYELTSFTGRSDYGPFIAVGIPAGGLFTGAEEVKTADERTQYGGLANAWLDPCYHMYCDTIDNVDWTVYEQMARAAAYALDALMMEEDLPGYLN